MWQSKFEDRLDSWVRMRHSVREMAIFPALQTVNQWWAESPWRPYYLHWNDQKDWPDPWELLSDNHFCDVARALGIMYTLVLLERDDINEAVMAETNLGNLVLVNDGKYILNWSPDEVLNISSTKITITRSLDSSEFAHLLG